MKKIFFAASLAMAGVVAAPACAATAAVSLDDAATLSPNAFVWQDTGQGAPVQVVVSLADQRAYVYRGDALVAVSTVSSGKIGKDTPIDTFPILRKDSMHKSSLYDAAPMPFMQRLTWDGVALHAGNNPGFPASHGCIRLPAAFARKLFGVTHVGTIVTITDTSVSEEAVDYGQTDATAVANANVSQGRIEQLAFDR